MDDTGHVAHQAARPAAHVRVNVDDGDALGTVLAQGVYRQRQPIEGAEAASIITTGMVKTGRQRSRVGPRSIRVQRGCDRATIRGAHRPPQARIPPEVVRLCERLRLTGLDGMDVRRSVHARDLFRGQRVGRLDANVRDRIADERLRDRGRLPRRVERVRCGHIVRRIENGQSV